MMVMKAAAPVVVIAALTLAWAAPAPAQTPAAQTPAAQTDIYHVHFAKAAPGQAAALGKFLSEPDKTAEMPDHFMVLRHQEGDDWDYAVIQHLGPKTTLTIPPPTTAGADLRAWHTDTFVAGPTWPEFTKQMAIGGSGKPGALYTIGVHRAVPGHRDQLEKALNQPPAANAKVQTGNLFMPHLEGSEWQFLTITRYDSWQDFATDRSTADPSAAGGWADIRQHSAFHRDTAADRIHPVK
jgi:hypothetical protein